jgi:drug/metabolite transporter (DMT)-like permease
LVDRWQIEVLYLYYQTMSEETLISKEPSKGLVAAAFAAVYILWGSTYVGIVIAIKTVPPFLMAGTRFFAAGIILYIWCLLRGEKTPDIVSSFKSAGAGTLMLFCGTTSLIWSEQYIPSGLAAVVIASVPFWFVLLDKANWKANFTNMFTISGLVVGFIGILLLFNKRASFNLFHKAQLTAFVVLLIGSISWAAGSLYSKYSGAKGTTTMLASIQMMTAGICGFITSILSGETNHFVLSDVSTHSIYAILYLITFGSLVGYIAYVWLLKVRPPALVGTYAYVNPVVAMSLGWLLNNEMIAGTQIAALVIILSGVLLVNLSKYKKF